MPRRTPSPRPTAYAIATWGTPAEILEALHDPGLTPDDLAALAPGYQDPHADVELVRAALTHPAVSSGVVARYATHRDAGVRALVAAHSLTPSTALQALAHDPDPRIAQAAQHRLDHPPRPCRRRRCGDPGGGDRQCSPLASPTSNTWGTDARCGA